MSDKIKEFFEKVVEERKHQADRWADGTEDGLDAIDDDNNGACDFVAHIAHHATRWFPGGFPPWSVLTLESFRKQMVNVAALAFAADKWAGRQIADIDTADAALQRGVSKGVTEDML